MSAAELLNQVKLLPPDERRKLVDSLLAFEEAWPGEQVGEPTQGNVNWPDPRERLERIFGSRVLSENIVLAEREEERY